MVGMRILVLNSGSSSIKFSMFDVQGQNDPRLLYDGELSGVGGAEATLAIQAPDIPGLSREPSGVKAQTLQDAILLILDAVSGKQMPAVEAVGYRVVHPGAKLKDHQRITPEVLRDLEEAVAFAPLHDPEVIEVIRAGMKRFSEVAHYACCDTVFHQTMPEEATTYPVPAAYREQGARRYGFHGLSCESIVRQLQAAGELPRRMVIAHLGSGCSVTALLEGRSVDTTMGLTPTGGVVMGTRPGDLDPGLMLYLLRQQKGGHDEAISKLETMFNHESGMVALTGMENDMKAVRKAAADGNAQASLALKIFTRSVKKAIGGFCWLLSGLDAIVFAGGIGEHDAQTRAEVLSGLDAMGIVINFPLNAGKPAGLQRISASQSKTEIFVIPAQEDLMIAVHVDRMARSKP